MDVLKLPVFLFFHPHLSNFEYGIFFGNCCFHDSLHKLFSHFISAYVKTTLKGVSHYNYGMLRQLKP